MFEDSQGERGYAQHSCLYSTPAYFKLFCPHAATHAATVNDPTPPAVAYSDESVRFAWSLYTLSYQRKEENESMAYSHIASNQRPIVWSWIVHGYFGRIHKHSQSVATSACLCGIACACYISIPSWRRNGITAEGITAKCRFPGISARTSL